MKFSKQVQMVACLAAVIALEANASIFLEYLTQWLNYPTFAAQKALLVWQLGGMVVPLLAGPCRIAANSIWNFEQVSGGVTIDSGMIKANLWINWEIESIDDLMSYLVDYVVYGKAYGLIGFSTTFTEIAFMPSDVQCYNWNSGTTADPPT